jgi:hypothetical protein
MHVSWDSAETYIYVHACTMTFCFPDSHTTTTGKLNWTTDNVADGMHACTHERMHACSTVLAKSINIHGVLLSSRIACRWWSMVVESETSTSSWIRSYQLWLAGWLALGSGQWLHTVADPGTDDSLGENTVWSPRLCSCHVLLASVHCARALPFIAAGEPAHQATAFGAWVVSSPLVTYLVHMEDWCIWCTY